MLILQIAAGVALAPVLLWVIALVVVQTVMHWRGVLFGLAAAYLVIGSLVAYSLQP